jgi:hypothetical protein
MRSARTHCWRCCARSSRTTAPAGGAHSRVEGGRATASAALPRSVDVLAAEPSFAASRSRSLAAASGLRVRRLWQVGERSRWPGSGQGGAGPRCAGIVGRRDQRLGRCVAQRPPGARGGILGASKRDGQRNHRRGEPRDNPDPYDTRRARSRRIAPLRSDLANDGQARALRACDLRARQPQRPGFGVDGLQRSGERRLPDRLGTHRALAASSDWRLEDNSAKTWASRRGTAGLSRGSRV